MTLASLFVIAHLTMGADTTVIVTKDNDAKTPLEGAAVSVFRGESRLDEQFTGSKGTAILKGSQSYTASDLLRVKLAPYDTHDDSWPEDTNPIRVKLPEPRKPCTYTVQRQVFEQGPDGRTQCRTVYDRKECPPGGPPFSPPLQVPPVGYKWELVGTDSWVNAQGNRETRPWWRLVPGCPESLTSSSVTPCGCQ
jgi:hypothetical protein